MLLKKEAIETALKDVEEAMKSDDKEAIEAKTNALMEASQKLGEKVYAEQQAAQNTKVQTLAMHHKAKKQWMQKWLMLNLKK